MLKVVLLTVGALLAVAIPLNAQSLADVARAEEARRKTVKGQAKVYTNDTLRGADGGEAPAPPPSPSAPAPASGAAATGGAAGAPVKPGATPGAKPPASPAAAASKDEKYWRDRLS